MQILRQAEAAGSSGSGNGGGGHQATQKRTEAKLVLQLATWMANTGQGAKSDITGSLLLPLLMLLLLLLLMLLLLLLLLLILLLLLLTTYPHTSYKYPFQYILKDRDVVGEAVRTPHHPFPQTSHLPFACAATAKVQQSHCRHSEVTIVTQSLQ